MKFVITVPAVSLEYDKQLVRKILGQAGKEIANVAKDLIGRSSRGAHGASAPGGPPDSLTGALKRGVRFKMRSATSVSIFDDAMDQKSGKNAYYAVMLESGAVGGGGKKGSKNLNRTHKRGAGPGKPQTKRIMAARPFISTAADAAMPDLQKRIAEALSKGIDLKVLREQRR